MKAINKIKYIICVCLLIAAFVLCGCGARVDVYEETDGENYYFNIDIGVDEALDSKLNASAAINEQTNKKWTLGSWFNAYMGELGKLYGFNYVYPGVMNELASKSKIYRFMQITVGTDNEYMNNALGLEGDYTVSTNLFFRTVKVERDDRFNYFISEFKDAYSRLESGPLSADSETAMGIFLFGIRNVYPYESYPNPDPSFKYDEQTGEVYKIALPAFGDVFDVDVSDYKKLDLRNFWHVTARIKAESDDTAIANINGSEKFYYVFSKEAGDGETVIRYSYLRADPTGWYIVAIVAGGIAVGISIWLVKRNKRKAAAPPPPQPQDDYPYDPFDGNIDPFA